MIICNFPIANKTHQIDSCGCKDKLALEINTYLSHFIKTFFLSQDKLKILWKFVVVSASRTILFDWHQLYWLLLFRVKRSNGTVKLNGKVRNDYANSEKLIAYIPQQEQLRKSLTVYESMTLAAHLKLGFAISLNAKREKVS